MLTRREGLWVLLVDGNKPDSTVNLAIKPDWQATGQYMITEFPQVV
jgi:hypothetical protein